METVPLYKIPYGSKFQYPDDDIVYIHERGDGRFPFIRNTLTDRLERGYIGQEVVAL